MFICCFFIVIKSFNLNQSKDFYLSIRSFRIILKRVLLRNKSNNNINVSVVYKEHFIRFQLVTTKLKKTYWKSFYLFYHQIKDSLLMTNTSSTCWSLQIKFEVATLFSQLNCTNTPIDITSIITLKDLQL